MKLDLAKAIAGVKNRLGRIITKANSPEHEENRKAEAMRALQGELKALETAPDAGKLGAAIRVRVGAYCNLHANPTLEEVESKMLAMHVSEEAKKQAAGAIELVNELDYAKTAPGEKEVAEAVVQCSRLAAMLLDEIPDAPPKQAAGNKTVAPTNNTVLRSSSPVKDNGLSAQRRTKAAQQPRGRKP